MISLVENIGNRFTENCQNPEQLISPNIQNPGFAHRTGEKFGISHVPDSRTGFLTPAPPGHNMAASRCLTCPV